MTNLLELARQLGQTIAADERTAKLNQAQEALNQDEAARKLLQDYQQQAEHIRKLEAAQKPIEVEEKHKLIELEQNISTNAVIGEMTRRQVDFVDMMRKVKETIDAQIQTNKKA